MSTQWTWQPPVHAGIGSIPPPSRWRNRNWISFPPLTSQTCIYSITANCLQVNEWKWAKTSNALKTFNSCPHWIRCYYWTTRTDMAVNTLTKQDCRGRNLLILHALEVQLEQVLTYDWQTWQTNAKYFLVPASKLWGKWNILIFGLSVRQNKLFGYIIERFCEQNMTKTTAAFS